MPILTDCFFCGEKIRLWTNYSNIATMANFGESIPPGMTDKDKVCEKCISEGKTQKGYVDRSKPTLPSDSQDDIPPVKDFVENFITPTVSKTNPETNPYINPTRNSKTTTSDELRTLTTVNHNAYKSKWDKNGIIQFKNDRIAILKRIVGQQVQFIVAYDQVTEEGYRLMAIDEGMTASGSGFSGGASAYFYFQKMEYVR
jgi:hypothetical protein